MLRSALTCFIRARGWVLLLLVWSAAPGLSWAQTHEGFQRRDGSMYLVRNGEARPMTRDVRLPNGRLVTRDGFVVERDGKRVELADGQGCTLLGQAAGVATQPDGRLTLAVERTRQSATDAPEQAILTQLQRWFGTPGPGPGRGRGKGHFKKAGKHKHRPHPGD